MRRLVCLALALLLVVAIVPASVLAENNTPDTAIVLTAQNAGHAALLVGDTGGSVHFYRIDYAGDGQPVKIDVTTIPGRDSSGPAVGFKLYGPAGFIGEAPVEHNESTWTRYSMTLNSMTAGAYLVQVYNFTAGMAVDYNIQASGLPEATQPPAATPVGSTPNQPANVSQTNTNVAGTLVGQNGGNFQYLSFDYPGGNTALTIELKYSPPSPFSNGAVGFNLYNGSDLIGQGSETQRNSDGATVSYTLTADAGGTYLLQTFNYEPGFTANYVLSISGTAGQVQQSTDNTVPEKALVLTAASSAAKGSIAPGQEAAFNYFLFNHPGNGATVTVRLTVDNADGMVYKSVGFNLYKGADLAGHVDASLDSKGNKWVGSLSFTEGSPVGYGIQVFNYSGQPANYSLYVSGLQ